MSQSNNSIPVNGLRPAESVLPGTNRRSGSDSSRSGGWQDDTVIAGSRFDFSPASATRKAKPRPDSDPVEEFFRDLHMPADAIDPPRPAPTPAANPNPESQPKGPTVKAYNRDYVVSAKSTRRNADPEPVANSGYNSAASAAANPVSEPVDDRPVGRFTPAAKAKPKKPRPTAATPVPPPQEPPKEHHRKWPWVVLILLILFVGIPAAFWFLYPARPDSTVGKVGDVATFLLAGTDQDGTRTDTLILLYVNRDTKAINLLSLPRDSRVEVDGEDMKLNAVYAYGGCGEEGMELLMDEMKDVLGYRPDAYVLFDFDSLEEMIDTMGGITFDVPMDMYYEDSSQDLYIDLKAGMQTLSGEDAVKVLRFRSGYALADLERINVQRQMINAAMKQWLSPSNLISGISAINGLSKDATTNVSTRNLFWLAQSALYVDLGAMKSETLPGEWDSPYYELYYNMRADVINDGFNPTNHTFTGDDFPE